MKRLFIPIVAVCCASVCLAATVAIQAQSVAPPLLSAKSWAVYPKDAWMYWDEGKLTLDDARRRLTVESSVRPLGIPYDAVEKVVFETTSHVRAGGASTFIGLAGSAIEAGTVSDYLVLIEYRAAAVRPDAQGTRWYLAEVAKDAEAAVRAKMVEIFGPKVSTPQFPQAVPFKRHAELQDINLKHNHDYECQKRPTPEVRPDKGLVVVVAPCVDAKERNAQFKLYANGRVVAVNRVGSYSFVYLDPGNYEFVSAPGYTSMQVTVEAGKGYYFLQNSLAGDKMNLGRPISALSMNSEELVRFEITGAAFSVWKQKK